MISHDICVFFLALSEVDKETMTVNDLMQYGYVELKLIIEWARKVPGTTAAR